MSRLSERIENFNRAFNLFCSVNTAYTADKCDITKLALIQSYEIVIELSWKILKDYLALREIKVLTPLDTIKEAFSADIILEGSIWIDMIKDRNISSHEYNINKSDEISERISTIYFNELSRFKKLTEVLDGR